MITLVIAIFIFCPFWIGVEPLTKLDLYELWMEGDYVGIFLFLLFFWIALFLIILPGLMGFNWNWGWISWGFLTMGLFTGSYNKRSL